MHRGKFVSCPPWVWKGESLYPAPLGMERRTVLSPRVCIGGSLYPAPNWVRKRGSFLIQPPQGMQREEFTYRPFGHGKGNVCIQPPLGMKRGKDHIPWIWKGKKFVSIIKKGGLYPLPSPYLKREEGNTFYLTCKCFLSTWYVSFDILITNLLLLFMWQNCAIFEINFFFFILMTLHATLYHVFTLMYPWVHCFSCVHVEWWLPTC